MAGTATPIYPQLNSSGLVSIGNADTTTAKTVYKGGINGSQITNISVAMSQGSGIDIQFSLLYQGTNFLLSTFLLASSTGLIDTVPSTSILRSSQIPGLSLDASGNPILYLGSGVQLQVAALTTVTSGKAIFVYAQAGDY